MAQFLTELPLYSDEYYEYRVSLEDETRLISFRWQERTSSWFLDIRQDDLTPVVLGVKLVPYFPLLADYQLAEAGITGYFALLDKGDFVSGKLSSSPSAKSQYYRLFYVHEEED